MKIEECTREEYDFVTETTPSDIEIEDMNRDWDRRYRFDNGNWQIKIANKIVKELLAGIEENLREYE